VGDCCVTPREQRLSYVIARTSCFLYLCTMPTRLVGLLLKRELTETIVHKYICRSTQTQNTYSESTSFCSYSVIPCTKRRNSK